MAFLKEKLKNNGDRTSLFLKPYLRANMSDRCMPKWFCYRFPFDVFLLALLDSCGY